MKVIKSRVSVPENYTTTEGVEKTFWHDIGIITTFEKEDGTKSSQLFIPALSLKAQVFPIVEKKSK